MSGKVLDASDGSTVPFVHIVPFGEELRGTQSSTDGTFSLEVPEGTDRLVVSSVGYVKDTIPIASMRQMRIEIERRPIQKGAVDIRSERNPAIPIVRKAIAHREKHDPLGKKAFGYRSYNKIVYSDRSLNFDSSWVQSGRGDSIEKDSNALSIPDSIHAFIMETVVERSYVKARFDKKKVMGARVSGFRDPPFTTIASELQGISFYRDYVEILGSEYRSPISKGALGKYQFRLHDRLVEEGRDTLFFIEFHPKGGQRLQALEGMIAIGSDAYAIRSVRASPVKQGPNPIRVEQDYRRMQGASFPVLMNFELRLPAFGMVYNGKSRLQNVRVGRDAVGKVERKDLSIEKAKDLGDRDSAFWEEHRSEALSRKDSNTYRVIDSLGREKDLDRTVDIMEKLLIGRYPIGPLNLRLYELYRYNDLEKNRLGLGLESNEKVSSYFRFGGFWGYGMGDERMKYGGDLEFRPTGDLEWQVGVYYRQDLEESSRYASPRAYRFLGTRSPLSASAQRPLYSRRYISVEEKGVRFRTSRPRYLTLGLWAQRSKERFLYDPPYLDLDPASKDLELVETALRFRFAYGEQRMKSFGRKLSIETPYPVLHGKLMKGWKSLGGERSYWKFFARLEHDFSVRGFGRGDLTLDLGGSFGELPLSRLTYAPGTYSRDFFLFVPSSFNTARRYQDLHSRFIHFFYDQELLRTTLIEGVSRPLFRLRHHMGWGDQRGFESLSKNGPGTMEEGYYESGLTIEDLVYSTVQNMYSLGVGVSFAYRYGPYSTPSVRRNFAYGVELSVGL